MNTRKRRSPARRTRGRTPAMLAGAAGLVGSAAMRNPTATGGTVVFFIVFSFVAANALWYQPSAHPHPWLDTRDAFRDYTAHAMHGGNAGVTTFKVDRGTVAVPRPVKSSDVRPQPAAKNAVVVEDSAPAVATTSDASGLVTEIQKNLARRGLYDGAPDGLMGPKTQAAILFYQQTRGLPETGTPDVSLLKLLQQDNAEFSVVPAERPTPDVTGAIKAKNSKPGDPIAALIHQSVAKKVNVATKPASVPVAKVPVPAAATSAADGGAPSDLVLQIQKGLARFSYTNLTVDGIDGEQTHEAIRHFETHYHLPVTGEPSVAVLKKLKQIGAL